MQFKNLQLAPLETYLFNLFTQVVILYLMLLTVQLPVPQSIQHRVTARQLQTFEPYCYYHY